MRDPWLILFSSDPARLNVGAVKTALRYYPASRICVAVLEQFDPWWRPMLDLIPEENIVVQPFDRGTGAAVLAACLHVHNVDPDAELVIALAPADADEAPAPLVAGTCRHIVQRYLEASPLAVSRIDADLDHLDRVYIELPWLGLEDVFAHA